MEKRSFLFSTLLIAFLEGCVVLSVELIVAKILATYYGASFIIWTSIIGITLIGLTGGYYLGARLAEKKNIYFLLWLLFFITACLITSIPFSATKVMLLCFKFGLREGAVISVLILMGPALLCLGSISPLLIQFNVQQINSSGKIAGWIYAASTIGGIFSSFLLGFLIIPQWGMKIPLLFTALLILICISFLIFNFKYILINILLIIGIIFLISAKLFEQKSSNQDITTNLLHDSEGILGQLKVFDRNDPGVPPARYLSINSILQSKNLNAPFISYNYGVSLWAYPHLISMIASINKAPGAHALVCGFGGGAVSSELDRLGFSMDVVELDKRIIDIGIKYFHYDTANTHFIVDDARHYIRTSTKQYDLIVLDLLNGEIQPFYVFTLESFLELKKIIKPNGIVIMLYEGPVDIQKGVAVRSIMNTLTKSGLNAYYWSQARELLADVLFYASPNEIDFSKLSPQNFNLCCLRSGKLDEFIQKPYFEHNTFLKDGYVLNDNQPILENLNTAAIMEWRKTMNNLMDEQLKEGVFLFK